MPYNQSTKAKIFFSGDRQVMIPPARAGKGMLCNFSMTYKVVPPFDRVQLVNITLITMVYSLFIGDISLLTMVSKPTHKLGGTTNL